MSEELVTPVEFAKQLGIPPQQAYSYIKRGMPTHLREHKGKTREMVNPREAKEWLAIYDQTKRHRKSSGEEGADSGAPSPGKGSNGRVAKGQLLTYERAGGHIAVGELTAITQHFAYLERHAYTFPFVLNPTRKRSVIITPEGLRERLRKGELLLDTPMQVLDYVLAFFDGVNPVLAEELRAVLERHKAETLRIQVPKFQYVGEEVANDPLDTVLPDEDTDQEGDPDNE